MRRHKISFKHAFDGLYYVFKSQPNFRVHALAALIVLMVAFWLKVSTGQLIILLFTIMWVIVAEMVNTAIEAVVDLVTQERRQDAKIAKDVAAGMVLISAMLAIVVGLIIFLPYLSS